MATTKRDVAADVAAMKDLLLWARTERISIGQAQVGDVLVAGVLDRKGAVEVSAVPGPARRSIIEEYAGAAANALGLEGPAVPPPEGQNEPTIEDDDG